MKQYEYVSICHKGSFVGKYESHREIIDHYAKRGYKYVGYIPIKLSSTAFPMELDLIFEKDIEEK